MTGLPGCGLRRRRRNRPGAGGWDKGARDQGVGDQSGAANQPDGDQGDADVADDSVISAEKILSRDAKKISTPGQPGCHYMGMERGHHSAHRADYNPKFIGKKDFYNDRN